MAYPSSLDELTDGVPSDGAAPTTALDNATYPHDDHHRALATAVEAVEAELGTLPKGGSADVKTRIAATETVADAAVPKSTVTTTGDLIYGTGSGAVTRLGIGTALQVLRTNAGATAPEWADLSLTNITPTTVAVNGATLSTVEKLGVNAYTTADVLANVILSASATTAKPLVVQGKASQTANLQEWQNSAGTPIAYVTSGGVFSLAGNYMQNINAVYATGSGQVGLDLGRTGPANSVSILTGGTQRLTVASTGGITIAEASDLTVGTATGTKIGTATTQKLGFWNATPVVQPTAVADASGGATIDAEGRTALNALLARLRTVGIIAT